MSCHYFSGLVLCHFAVAAFFTGADDSKAGTVFLYSSGCPGPDFVEQAGLEEIVVRMERDDVGRWVC